MQQRREVLGQVLEPQHRMRASVLRGARRTPFEGARRLLDIL